MKIPLIILAVVMGALCNQSIINPEMDWFLKPAIPWSAMVWLPPLSLSTLPPNIAMYNRKPCDTASCAPPCQGAAPPPRCPPNVTACASGCACVTLCENMNAVYCFTVNHCLKKKRFTPRRKKTTKRL